MKINVLDLRKAPKELDIHLTPHELNLVADGYRFPEPVAGLVRFQLVSGRVLANGHLDLAIEAECGRCLSPIKDRIRAKVQLVYEKRPAVEGDGRDGLALEWEAEAHEIEYYDEEILDPKEGFRQVLLLELPNYPMCKADCRGLCPHCGADLNQHPCRCEADESEAVVSETDWKSRLKQIHLT